MKLESLLILDNCQVILPGIHVRTSQHLIWDHGERVHLKALLCRHNAFVRPAQMAAYIGRQDIGGGVAWVDRDSLLVLLFGSFPVPFVLIDNPKAMLPSARAPLT